MENVHHYVCARLLEILLREELLSLAEDGKSITDGDRTLFFIDAGERHSLNRFEIHSENIRFLSKGNTPITIKNYAELLDVLGQTLKIDPADWSRFSEEYANHVNNFGLVAKTAEARLSNHNFFEQRVPLGHPHHPCPKTRLGFSDAQVQAYTSDFNPSIPVCLAGVSPELIHLEKGEISYIDWFRATFPDLSLDFKPQDFVPIFIHPWQLENKVKKLFSHWFEAKKIVLSSQTCPMIPSLSFRTLVPMRAAIPCFIKLPVAILSTGGVRTVSAATAENGPKISRIISTILKNEGLDRYLKLMPETIGLHAIDKDAEKMRNFSMVVRENHFSKFPENEEAVVLAALLAKQISDEKPIFFNFMRSAHISTLEQARAYFRLYCEICLRGFLDFYLLTGIALEAHQQNCIVVFKNHKPSYFIYRDLAGIRAHLPSLKKYGYDFIPFPNSDTFIDDRVAAANKLLHTVYGSNLGEFILLLAKEFSVEESIFWTIVKEITSQRFEELKSRIPEEFFEQDRKCFLENDWPLKAMLRMRLAKNTRENIYLKIRNPLKDLVVVA